MQGAVEILNYYLNDTTYDQIFTHGCWCAHLADQKDNEFQGVDIEDELDYICKGQSVGLFSSCFAS